MSSVMFQTQDCVQSTLPYHQLNYTFTVHHVLLYLPPVVCNLVRLGFGSASRSARETPDICDNMHWRSLRWAYSNSSAIEHSPVNYNHNNSQAWATATETDSIQDYSQDLKVYVKAYYYTQRRGRTK